MKILLMGGTGWLGHNIAKLLDACGADVTILTRGKRQTFAGEVTGIKAIVADKSDEEAMRRVFETPYTHIIDTVPTVASIGIVRKYATHLHHYIHCSSTGGYTPLPFIPCNETAQYGGFGKGTGWDQKRIVDNLVMQAFREDAFPATVIRPCYITGIGMLPLDNCGSRRKDFIKDVMEGNVLDVANDGNALLQPIHVKDLAQSFVLSLTHRRSIGEIYNICLEHAVTFNRYLEITAHVFNKVPKINYMSIDALLAKYGNKINETDLRFAACHMCFSIDKAIRDLDYAPKYTPEEAIEETALWASTLY